jgi:sugar phosphate isomerase/epimerase
VRTIRGPGLFLAQFVADGAPFDTLAGLAGWAGGLGYVGVQLPTWDARLFDLARAADSDAYCDEVSGICADAGVVVTELSTHLQGQLIAAHPAYQPLFESFAPPALRGNPTAQREWATAQLHLAARASQRLGLTAHATFSGALLWHTVYPWPQRARGLVADGFAELARRWRPVLDAFDAAGIDLCYEIHPGEDLHDGASFERFLATVDDHPRCHMLYDPSHLLLQQMDYVAFIDIYHTRIRMFHVKDAEYRPSGRTGVYGGYLPWLERAGRFRSLGDGQIDFRAVFSQFARYDYAGWAVVEWECVLKHPEDGAREGAAFVRDHIIRVTPRAFDDFAGGAASAAVNRRILGID